MAMHLQTVLEGLGFSAKEARVYLAALALGECHVSDIAEKVQLPRTSVEVIVEKLRIEGLMNFYVMRRYKYWIAENPERLLERFKQREAAMQDALPRLLALKRAPKGARATDTARGSEFMRMVADASAEPILIANAAREIIYVNAPWEKQFGYALHEVRGENPRIFQSGETSAEVYRRMRLALDAEHMFQSDEIIDKKKDGSVFNLLTTIFPVRRDGMLFWIQVLADITEKKRAEEIRKKFL